MVSRFAAPRGTPSGLTCLSRKPEALHTFDLFRVSLHAGAADSSIFPHVMVRRFLVMLPVISALLACIAGFFRSRAALHLEHLALRHQLAVYQHTMPRPRLRPTDRLFRVWLSRLWAGWQEALAFVQPRTVIAWQQKCFRDHWWRLSQGRKPGRPAIAQEVRDLIQRMWQANPFWGAPRIVADSGNSALTWQSLRSRSTGSGPGNRHHRRGRRS
jgi:hypothetical protein